MVRGLRVGWERLGRWGERVSGWVGWRDGWGFGGD